MNNRIFEIDENSQLVIKETGEPIPSGEPIFILLGRDCQAPCTIRVYQSLMTPMSEGWKTIQDVINDFMKFRKENPDLIVKPEEAYG